MALRYRKWSTLQRYIFCSLLFGFLFAILLGIQTKEPSGVLFGYLLGAIAGLAVYRALSEPSRLKQKRSHLKPRQPDVPQDKIFSFRLHAGLSLLLLPILGALGFVVSLLLVGNGLWGLSFGIFLAMALSFATSPDKSR